MNGILLINKSSGYTSNQVLQQVKRKFNFTKVGHAGTLDPLAEGLLVLLINKATKLSQYLLTNDKEYLVEMKLFVQTDSADITGKIINLKSSHKIQMKKIRSVFAEFNGYIYNQIPPKYSAIKVKGKKLYEYARRNEDVKILPRKVTIKKIVFKKYSFPQAKISFFVKCSKGTYIRSLVEDIAKKMDTIATVSKLVRIKSGNFELSKSYKIDKISENNLVSMYDALILNNYDLIQYHNIRIIKLGYIIHLPNIAQELIFIINASKEVIAIYKHVGMHNYKCLRVI